MQASTWPRFPRCLRAHRGIGGSPAGDESLVITCPDPGGRLSGRAVQGSRHISAGLEGASFHTSDETARAKYEGSFHQNKLSLVKSNGIVPHNLIVLHEVQRRSGRLDMNRVANQPSNFQ